MSKEQESNNKRIAKNTLLLYFRMIFLSLISFFTVRVTLDALGVVNYGISNVVGSIVSSLTFISGTLSSATQRYFSFQLGKNDISGYQKVFSLLLICYFSMSLIILVVGESLGYFFIYKWLNIPSERLYAAYWYFHTVLLTFVINLMVIPFSSSMISHEKMSGFAYISIFDAVIKLTIAYLIYISSYDKLIIYGFLILMSAVLNFLLYYIYCRKNFEGCRFKKYWEKGLFKELLSYTGWNLFGSVSGVLATQGQNILLNIYFGPIVNTAKGIADKITSVVQSFSSNFYMAVSPQIIKSYASNEIERMYNLVISSTKFSFYLLLILSYPLIICMDSLLILWLGSNNVSETMISFSRLCLIYCMVSSLEQPITQMIRATGRIKNYQIFVGIITLMFIPVAALFLYMRFPAKSTMIVLIIIYGFAQLIRIIIAKIQLRFPYKNYIINSLLPILGVSVFLSFIYYISRSIQLGVIVKLTLNFIICIATIFIIGLTKSEKQLILCQISRRFHK